MTTNNRYDKLNELDEADSATPLLTDEWVQAPDGSWVRSSDKVARKLAKKSKRKSDPQPEPEPKPKPARAKEPEPRAEPKAEPKRGLFARRSAEKQRKAEQEHERKAELERQAELERERRAELRRQAELEEERKAEFERQAELERQRQADLEYEAELERERKAELAREFELERERKAEIERERKAERERLAELERERKAEVQRQAALERERKAELERERKQQAALERQAELERKAEQKRGRKHKADPEREAELERERQAELARTAKAETTSPFFTESDRLLARWPESTSEYPAEPEPWVSSSSPWPEDDYEPKHEPRHQAAPHVRLSTSQRITQVAIAVGLVAATLVIGAAINWLSPDLERSQRPFANSGEPGESLDVRTFTITVQTARAAASVQSGQTPQDTQGTWVIVRVRLTANTEPTRIGYAALRDSAGKTYLASDRISQPLLDGKRMFQPGIPIEGEVVFEVPKDALGGLTALFAARPGQIALDAMASVELPALTVAADQPPATLAPNEVRP